MSEVFSVGDMVTYAAGSRGQTILCKIVQVMPVEHPQATRNYRIRGSSEAFERAVPEFTLTAVRPSVSDMVFKS